MKSISWTHPMDDPLPSDDDEPHVEPDVQVTAERPMVTAELAEKSRKSAVLRAMARMYAPYTGADGGDDLQT